MTSNYDTHLNEKFGTETTGMQAIRFLTKEQWAEINNLRDNSDMMLWEAIETVVPELVGKVWIVRSADDAIVVTL